MRQDTKRLKPEERVKNFLEVALGFTAQEAGLEAKRCLQCKDPQCVKGCPVGIDIPVFIALLLEGKYEQALDKIKEKNSLPAICGRVCPQESQCELKCILGKKGQPINIGKLERFAADAGGSAKKTAPSALEIGGPATVDRSLKNEKVAVVGSGPAGLTAAAELAKMQYSVVLFESLHLPGGVLSYGIPNFRLPKDIVESEVRFVESLGVKLNLNFLIGKTKTIDELFKEGFKAVFLAVGAGLPQFLNIPGEDCLRVYSANEFLTRINLMHAYKFPEYKTPLDVGKRVAVIGAGNVAFDSARSSLRLGAKAVIVYRRSREEMPARQEEVENALQEGVELHLLTAPIEIISDEDGRVKALKCIKMRLGQPDESGRRRPIPIEGSQFLIEADTVVVAIGQRPNPLLAKADSRLKTNKNGTLAIDEHLMTSVKGVFAGGDIVTGADTVISAMAAGKKAAVEIDRFIKGKA